MGIQNLLGRRQMIELFNFSFLDEKSPIIVGNIPDIIFEEIKTWVRHGIELKYHPLADLKAHENIGYLRKDGIKYNAYQCGISNSLVEDSFWIAWVLRLSSMYFGNNKLSHKDLQIRKREGHFDGYDIWLNFSYKGNENPRHIHQGFLSGVIYYQNHDHPTIFPEYNLKYKGTNKTMVLFPSETLHYVEKQVKDVERITIAFNVSVSSLRKNTFTRFK
jgi:hypothetical protein